MNNTTNMTNNNTKWEYKRIDSRYYYCTSRRLYFYLTELGYEHEAIMPSMKKQGELMWKYRNSDKLQDDLQDYFENTLGMKGTDYKGGTNK